MNFIKKYKYLLIIVFVLIILAVLAFLTIRLLYPDGSKSLYGNRLIGIENVSISNSTISKIKETLNATKKVVTVEYNLQGRVINFFIKVNKECDLLSAKTLTDGIIGEFSKEQKTFYDFQVFLITENSEDKKFPSIGYRHKTLETFKWNNNN